MTGCRSTNSRRKAGESPGSGGSRTMFRAQVCDQENHDHGQNPPRHPRRVPESDRIPAESRTDGHVGGLSPHPSPLQVGKQLPVSTPSDRTRRSADRDPVAAYHRADKRPAAPTCRARGVPDQRWIGGAAAAGITDTRRMFTDYLTGYDAPLWSWTNCFSGSLIRPVTARPR